MWYNYLNNPKEKSLLKEQKIEDGNIIVSQELSFRKYTIFKKNIDLFNFLEKIDIEKKCLYEILTENQPRVPYFDVDIENELSSFDEQDFIQKLHKIHTEKYPDNPLLVFSSHTEKKKSYHILVRGVYTFNHREGLEFYKDYIHDLEEKYRQYFDQSVYKSVQQFRILGTHKYGKTNTKIFREDLSLGYKLPKRCKDQKSKDIHNFYISLISNVQDCQYLDKFQQIAKKEKKTMEQGSCNEEDIEKALEIFNKSFEGQESTYSFIDYKEDNGNFLIIMKRNIPSECKLCQRVHENENPFLTVVGEERRIYFNCRRNDRNLYIDKLGEKIEILQDEKDEKEERENIAQTLQQIALKRSPKKKKKIEGDLYKKVKINFSIY